MKVIAGNWKMNGSRDALVDMVAALQNIETENNIILWAPRTSAHTTTAHIPAKCPPK